MKKKDQKSFWDSITKNKATYKLTDQENLTLASILILNDFQTLGQRLQDGSAYAVIGTKVSRNRSYKLVYINTPTTGSSVPFTWAKITTKSKPPKSKLAPAFRNAIQDQMANFRANLRFPVTCYLTGQKLYRWSKFHVDHVYPFANLVQDFLQSLEINPDSLTFSGRSAQTYQIADSQILKAWQDYHSFHARLAPVNAKANMSKGKKILDNLPEP